MTLEIIQGHRNCRYLADHTSIPISGL